MAKRMPFVKFGIARVQGAILSKAGDLEAIRDACMLGKMATVELGELTKNSTISAIDPDNTRFLSVNVDKKEKKVVFAFKTISDRKSWLEEHILGIEISLSGFTGALILHLVLHKIVQRYKNKSMGAQKEEADSSEMTESPSVPINIGHSASTDEW